MLELGSPIPHFMLPDLEGNSVSTEAFQASGLLIAFVCPHCPFVRHIRAGFSRFAREYRDRGLAVLAVNPNDSGTFPMDGPEGMKEEAELAGYTFPYLIDADQIVVKLFNAACTPDFFLFDREGRLAYRGRFDGSRPRNFVPVTGADLRVAADAVLDGRQPAAEQHPSMGCSIKWKPAT